jgi:hypothetical protein
MSTYMGYLYQQQPIDGLYHNVTVTGVPVSIDAVDPSGSSIHIATVTSTASGTYSYTWTAPTVSGDYKITATFAGTDAYGSSSADTQATVVSAPTATPTPPVATQPAPDTTPYIIGMGIAIIIAVAIATILILRKRP